MNEIAALDAESILEAAYALGESRLPGAMRPLMAWIETAEDPAFRGSLFTVLALHRSTER